MSNKIYHFKEITPEDLKIGNLSVSDILPLEQKDLISSFTKGFVFFLPSWYCFLMTYITGSSKKVAEYLINIKIFKDTQERKFNQTEIINGIWEWSFYNFEKSIPFFVSDRITKKEYSLILIERAAKLKTTVVSDSALENFLLNNGFMDEEYLIRVRKHRAELYKHIKEKYPVTIQE